MKSLVGCLFFTIASSGTVYGQIDWDQLKIPLEIDTTIKDLSFHTPLLDGSGTLKLSTDDEVAKIRADQWPAVSDFVLPQYRMPISDLRTNATMPLVKIDSTIRYMMPIKTFEPTGSEPDQH